MIEIKIPTNAEEAKAMALLGVKWLQDNAPDQLTQHHRDMQAEAGRAGFIAGVKVMRGNSLAWLKVDEFANNYAESVMAGEK